MIALIDRLKAILPELGEAISPGIDMPKLSLSASQWQNVATQLRDHPDLAFVQLSDLCGVDYAGYGVGEWAEGGGESASFSRGVEPHEAGRLRFGVESNLPLDGLRFAVVVHLLSISHNERLRLECRCDDNDYPVVPTLTDVWNAADWFEREAFDLFGILFDGHPDLRRILTDYGFNGHPFRKDFPLIGEVEVRYDPLKRRVVYQPVTIEPRVLVPRVVRDDNRYGGATVSED